MDKRVGVLGGGQLGRMLVEAANRLQIRVNVLDAPGSPAKQIIANHDHVDGSFTDAAAIQRLAAVSDIITIEIEHVDTEILEQIATTIDVQPSWKTIRTIQDKYLQKEHLKKHDVSTAFSLELTQPTTQELERVSKQLGFPFMLKSRKGAYDGRGNFPVRSQDYFRAALDALGSNKLLYAEEWSNFRMELAVMVVKTADGVLSFPTVETVHENSICKLTYAPARGVSASVNEAAQALARKAVASFWGKGVFGVEMFLLPDDRLLINEIAPRPHNSGHYTIEACQISQYQAHLRAILDLPIDPAHLTLRQPSIMLNILGGDAPDSHLRAASEALKHPGIGVHLYGKGEARKGRKMGHLTVCAPTMAEAEKVVAPMIAFIDAGFQTPSPKESESQPRSRSAIPAADRSQITSQSNRPLVAVTMGSDSDLHVLLPGIETLSRFDIPFMTRITSAHRTPRRMADFAAAAAADGIKVIIAAAGGAAHLPGMVAAYTTLPVIGVPVKPRIGDGMDSLLSICNMPAGVPVATVSINNSINAALLAVRILGVADPSLQQRMNAFMAENESTVIKKDEKLSEIGPSAYEAEKKAQP